jgi:hypothetical protein
MHRLPCRRAGASADLKRAGDAASMSYTKMQREIEKLLKAGGDFDADRLVAYRQAREIVHGRWIAARRYGELISVAHGGWFSAEEYLEPLAAHFVREREAGFLRFLCERDIRFKIEDLLFLMKYYAEDVSSWDEVLAIEVRHSVVDIVVHYTMSQTPSSEATEEVAKARYEALRNLDRYIGYWELLGNAGDPAYLRTVRELREKTAALAVRKKDLSVIKYRLA